jgi:hypothetical protein
VAQFFPTVEISAEQKLASGTKWAQLTGGFVLSVLPTGNLCGLNFFIPFDFPHATRHATPPNNTF